MGSFNTTCQPLTSKNYLLKIKMKTLIGLTFMALAVSMCSATEQSSLEAIKAELKEEMKAEMRDELRKIQDRIAEDMEQRIETPFALETRIGGHDDKIGGHDDIIEGL